MACIQIQKKERNTDANTNANINTDTKTDTNTGVAERRGAISQSGAIDDN